MKMTRILSEWFNSQSAEEAAYCFIMDELSENPSLQYGDIFIESDWVKDDIRNTLMKDQSAFGLMIIDDESLSEFIDYGFIAQEYARSLWGDVSRDIFEARKKVKQDKPTDEKIQNLFNCALMDLVCYDVCPEEVVNGVTAHLVSVFKTLPNRDWREKFVEVLKKKWEWEFNVYCAGGDYLDSEPDFTLPLREPY